MTKRKHRGQPGLSNRSAPPSSSHRRGGHSARPEAPAPAKPASKPASKPGVHGGPATDRPGRAHWLYGLHAVKAALANPRRRAHRLLATAEILDLVNNINGLSPETTTRDAITRMLPPGAVHQGVALLVEPLAEPMIEDVVDGLADRDKAVVLILDQVTDPQNVGAILRSAAAFNAEAVIVPDRNAPPETAAMAKAASGAVEVVPLVRVVNLARALAELKEAGFWVAGLDAQAPQTLAKADLSGKVALVLGAEGEGLRRLTRDHCDILVKLPISPRMESLNVSAAAAAALYELARTSS